MNYNILFILLTNNKMNNPVNLHINRYFTQDDKNEIIRLFREERKDVHEIAEKLNTLPNHVTWALIRWGYLQVKNNGSYTFD